METEASGGDLVVDVDSGVYGHRVTMLDFQPERPRAVPRDGHDRRLRGPAAAGHDRAVDLRVGRPEQDQRLPGRLRLLRARPHQGATRARRRARSSPTSCARRPSTTATGPDPPAVGGQVRRRTRSPSTKGGSPIGAGSPMSWTLEEVQAGQMEVTLRRRRAARLHVGGRVARPGLVQARLGHRRQDPRPARQREQRPRPDLGGARRHDRAARRLPRPVLPGGLPRGASRSRSSRSSSRSCRRTRSTTTSTRSSTRSGSTRVKEPNYGKAARRMYNVFRMNGQVPRGGLHPRAVRRAGDRAVPGLRAHPDARRRGRHRATRSTPTRWSRRSTA